MSLKMESGQTIRLCKVSPKNTWYQYKQQAVYILFYIYYIDGLMQDYGISSANVLEILHPAPSQRYEVNNRHLQNILHHHRFSNMHKCMIIAFAENWKTEKIYTVSTF